MTEFPAITRLLDCSGSGDDAGALPFILFGHGNKNNTKGSAIFILSPRVFILLVFSSFVLTSVKFYCNFVTYWFSSFATLFSKSVDYFIRYSLCWFALFYLFALLALMQSILYNNSFIVEIFDYRERLWNILWYFFRYKYFKISSALLTQVDPMLQIVLGFSTLHLLNLSMKTKQFSLISGYRLGFYFVPVIFIYFICFICCLFVCNFESFMFSI